MDISTEQLDKARELITRALQFHQDENPAEAEKLYLRVLESIPQFTLAHFNLGQIYYEQNNFEQAVYHYKEAAAQQPDDADILFNLALALKKTDKLSEAAKVYYQVLTLCPDDPEAHYNLALTLQARHEYDQAINSYQQAVALDPDYGPAHNNLGFLLHRQGRLTEAAEIYKKLIALNHNAVSARHMLAALEGKTTSGAPNEYVKEVFDNYSANYDNSLVNDLGYKTPALLRELLPAESADKTACRFTNCLDLGCGTGLSGAAFADLCQRISGIDLSNGMLELAAKKNIYHALHQGEIIDFLETGHERFDLFLATDVFVYLGDLAPVFQAVKKNALPSAMFLFSTEKTDNGYTLQPSGRYAHSINYIKTLCHDYGFGINRHQETNIRKEKGEWIQGYLFLLDTTDHAAEQQGIRHNAETL
jgi:predicted TPR repeat methyltransferase